MAVYNCNREEEVIDEPEFNVDDYLYCKITGSSNYDDYLCKKACVKLSPHKVLEEIDDPVLYSQLSDSVISFLKRTQKTTCESSSVRCVSENDTSEHSIVNNSSSSSPSPSLLAKETGKDFSSRILIKNDSSLLYLQLSKKDRGTSDHSNGGNINKQYEHLIDFQQTKQKMLSPQYVAKNATDVSIIQLVGEERNSNQQDKKLISSAVNNDNNNNMSSQSLQELPLKYITKLAQSVKSIKSNSITTIDNKNKDFVQQNNVDIINMTGDNNNKQNNKIVLKPFKNVALNFSKQYRDNIIHNSINNNSDVTSHHIEVNNNSNIITNSRKNNNDVLLMNQVQQSKILYRHLTSSENNKLYSVGGKPCSMPLSSDNKSKENLIMKDNKYLESSPPLSLPSQPQTLQLYTTTASVSNIICEKNANFTIPKSTMLMKTAVTTIPVKNILPREPLQQRQQQQRALNIVNSGSGNNYDSIITLSLDNSNNSNNLDSGDISGMKSVSNNSSSKFTANFCDDNKNNNNNSEIVIEIGDKNKLLVNSCSGGIIDSSVCLSQSLQQQIAPTMVCLKRGGGGDVQPSLPHHQQTPLFNRSHVTHIVERKLIPSNSSTNKFETTFIQKRSEQLIPIQPCRVLDNKQIIKQYCGPKIKSEKRKFSVVEQPVVISTAVLSQNDSPAHGSTVKADTGDVFEGVSNEQMSSLQRLLKLGTTTTVNMSNEEKKIKLETIVKKLWAKETSESSSSSSN